MTGENSSNKKRSKLFRIAESLGIKTEGKDRNTLKNEVYDILTDSKKSYKEDDFNVNSMARTIGGMVGEYQKMRSEVEEIVFSELNEMKEPIQSMKDEADDIKQSLTETADIAMKPIKTLKHDVKKETEEIKNQAKNLKGSPKKSSDDMKKKIKKIFDT
jgi:hypothetical protein